MKGLIARARRQQGAAFGFIAQALQAGASLLLLPFVVTRLPAAEIGVWYVFMTIQGLAGLADFGFQPTVARGFAAAFAGASEIRREGLVHAAGPAPNLLLVKQVLMAARTLYLGLAAGVLILLLTLGLFYITRVAGREIPDVGHVQLAWVVFVFGTALNLYLLWMGSFLVGAERITQNYLLVICNRGAFALFGIAALLGGGGLMSLAIINVAAALLTRVLASSMLRPLVDPLGHVRPSRQDVRMILGALWPNASRSGLVGLGAFLITRINVLVISTFAGLSASASYAVSLQLLGALAVASQVPTQVALSRMVALRVRHQFGALRHLFIGRHGFMVASVVVGTLFIVFAGQPLLGMIGSKLTLLPRPTFLLLGLVMLLEANHANCAFVITTANRVPFVKAALFSGVAVAVLSTVSAWAGFGALGAIAAQGLVQLAYNNWRWPMELWRELDA